MRVLNSPFGALRGIRSLVVGIVAGSMLIMPAVQPLVTQAAGTVIASQNISNTGDMSEAPQIALAAGRLYSIWGERSGSTIAYDVTTVGSTWPAASFEGTGTNTQYQWPDIVADSAGTLHMVYAVENTMYHRSKTLAGKLSSTHRIGSSNFPNPIRLAIAPNGTLWVIWRDTDGSTISYKRSTDGGLNWGGGDVASETGNMSSPDIAVGTDGIPHVVWSLRGSGTYKGEIRYADWNGSAFVKGSVTSDGGNNACCYDADPTISVDGQNVQHVAWRKNLDANGAKWAIMYAKRAPGAGWTDFTPVATTNGDAKYSPAVGTDTSGSVFITFSAPTNGNRPRLIKLVAKLPGEGWQDAMNVSSGNWDSRSAVVGNGGTAHVLVQHEVTQDHDEVYYYRVRFGDVATPANVDATPTFAKNPTNITTGIPVTFSAATGSPTQVRYHWDAAPTDADPWQTYGTNISVAAPAGITTEACQTHALYTQVRAGTGTPSAARGAPLTFDTGVQAAVRLVNPHSMGTPATFNLSAQVANPSEDGATDGDPTYTRESYAYLSINGYNDCSGLNAFSIPGSDSGTTPQAIANNNFSGAVVLPGDSTPGDKPVGVSITDKIGNLSSSSFTLTYDPSDTDPSVTGDNMQGLPVWTSSQTATITPDNANSIIRRLSFNNISVTDNIYGRKEGIPAGKQFWGVYIANTRDASLTADSTSLKWSAVRVPTPNSSFSVQWDLFSGLDYGSNLYNRSGTYYVFVRFLDGAGNPSVGSQRITVNLNAGYTLPVQRLPTVRR